MMTMNYIASDAIVIMICIVMAIVLMTVMFIRRIITMVKI